jgi:hypothetical protein
MGDLFETVSKRFAPGQAMDNHRQIVFISYSSEDHVLVLLRGVERLRRVVARHGRVDSCRLSLTVSPESRGV